MTSLWLICNLFERIGEVRQNEQSFIVWFDLKQWLQTRSNRILFLYFWLIEVEEGEGEREEENEGIDEEVTGQVTNGLYVPMIVFCDIFDVRKIPLPRFKDSLIIRFVFECNKEFKVDKVTCISFFLLVCGRCVEIEKSNTLKTVGISMAQEWVIN